MNLNRKSFFLTPENIIKDKIKSELPSLRVTRIPLTIQNVKNPGRFWVQIRNPVTRERLKKIESTIEKMKDQFKTFKVAPETGTLVIAPYEENNFKTYFRAIVKGHRSLIPEILVQVFFMDYGYSSECRLCDLKYLECNNDISNIPALALECKLAKIRPSIAHSFNDDWSQAAFDLFWTLINKSGLLFGEIYSIVNSVVTIELIHKNGEEEININHSLIEKRLAIKKEEDYFSRFNHNLRLQQSELSNEQCYHYEMLQYNQDYMPDIYPDPPADIECNTTVTLRGPFSPLEIELNHLIMAGRDKNVKIAPSSVNSVLLDTELEDSSVRLLVAGSVSQNISGHHLTLYNTTLMPRLPGLTALIILIFTPYMELRRNNFGSYYIGALCGLGFDPLTKKSIFPEHDLELHFDAEITIDDLQFINRLRHWMNIGMQVSYQFESRNNMEEVIICQNRIKDALLKLIDKERKIRTIEFINNFDKWGLYNESLLLHPNKPSMITNSIYKLHNALELEDENELQEITEHVKKLRILATEDPKKPENTNIFCKLCNLTLTDIFDLRSHLYTMRHRQNEEILGIKL